MIFKHINSLQRLDQLIRLKKTGNADELAQRLGISRRQVYNWLDELKSLGLEIVYNKERQSYEYDKAYKVKINIEVQELSESEKIDTNAGINFWKKMI